MELEGAAGLLGSGMLPGVASLSFFNPPCSSSRFASNRPSLSTSPYGSATINGLATPGAVGFFCICELPTSCPASFINTAGSPNIASCTAGSKTALPLIGSSSATSIRSSDPRHPIYPNTPAADTVSAAAQAYGARDRSRRSGVTFTTSSSPPIAASTAANSFSSASRPRASSRSSSSMKRSFKSSFLFIGRSLLDG